jgi:hypothetical protein
VEDNLVLFYYLSASKIWPDKRGGLWWQRPDKNGGRGLIRGVAFGGRGLIRMVAFVTLWSLVSGDTLLVFLYYLVASDIWPYKRGTTLLCVFGEKQNFMTNIHVYIYCICKDCVQSVHILIVYSVLLCKMSCRHFYDKYIKLHNIIFIIKNMVPLQLFYLILILSPSLSFKCVDNLMRWFGLWCLMPLSTIFQLYRCHQFYCWRKRSTWGFSIGTLFPPPIKLTTTI